MSLLSGRNVLSVPLLLLLTCVFRCTSEAIYSKCTDGIQEIYCIGVRSNVTTIDPADKEACISNNNCDLLIQVTRPEEEVFTWFLYAASETNRQNFLRLNLLNEYTSSLRSKPLKRGDFILELEDNIPKRHDNEHLKCSVKVIKYDKKINRTVMVPINEKNANATFTTNLKFENVTDDTNGSQYSLCVFESGTMIIPENKNDDPVDLFSDLTLYIDHTRHSVRGNSSAGKWQTINYITRSPSFRLWRNKRLSSKKIKSPVKDEKESRVATSGEKTKVPLNESSSESMARLNESTAVSPSVTTKAGNEHVTTTMQSITVKSASVKDDEGEDEEEDEERVGGVKGKETQVKGKAKGPAQKNDQKQEKYDVDVDVDDDDDEGEKDKQSKSKSASEVSKTKSISQATTHSSNVTVSSGEKRKNETAQLTVVNVNGSSIEPNKVTVTLTNKNDSLESSVSREKQVTVTSFDQIDDNLNATTVNESDNSTKSTLKHLPNVQLTNVTESPATGSTHTNTEKSSSDVKKNGNAIAPSEVYDSEDEEEEEEEEEDEDIAIIDSPKDKATVLPTEQMSSSDQVKSLASNSSILEENKDKSVLGVRSMHLIFWTSLSILVIITIIIVLTFGLSQKKQKKTVSIALSSSKNTSSLSSYSLGTTASTLHTV